MKKSLSLLLSGVLALGLVGVKLVQMNFERKHKDKK